MVAVQLAVICFLSTLQMSETEIPGEFRMFAVVGNTMRSFIVTVPRLFYVNCRAEDTPHVCAI